MALVAALLLVPIAYADTGAIEQHDDTYAQYSDGDSENAPGRDEHGQVSWLNTESNNPYHNLIALKIDLGAEFAIYPGSDVSEGIIIKCRPGDIVELPVVHAKPGYTFVGWSQGGVPSEIELGIFTTEVEMTKNAGSAGQTSLYAVYMNDEGDGFCTCGAYTKGVYKDDIERFQSEYGEYLAEHRGDSFELDVMSLIIIVLAVILALIVGYFIGSKKRHEQVKDVAVVATPNTEVETDPDRTCTSTVNSVAATDLVLEEKIKLV